MLRSARRAEVPPVALHGGIGLHVWSVFTVTARPCFDSGSRLHQKSTSGGSRTPDVL